MLQRNLLYAAVTRAKQLVVLVGSRRALAKAVRTQGAGRRYTALTQRLQPEPGRAASGRSVGGASVRATGSRAGVRARNSATNSPPRRARSSLGWDHAAAATVRHCEGCSEARVQHHSLRPGAMACTGRTVVLGGSARWRTTGRRLGRRWFECKKRSLVAAGRSAGHRSPRGSALMRHRRFLPPPVPTSMMRQSARLG